MAQSLGSRMLAMCSVGRTLKGWLDGIRTSVSGNRTAVVELIADHAAVKAELDEMHTWAEALATKLNSDGGVTDTDYDAVITNEAPDTLSASDPTAVPAALDSYE